MVSDEFAVVRMPVPATDRPLTAVAVLYATLIISFAPAGANVKFRWLAADEALAVKWLLLVYPSFVV